MLNAILKGRRYIQAQIDTKYQLDLWRGSYVARMWLIEPATMSEPRNKPEPVRLVLESSS